MEHDLLVDNVKRNVDRLPQDGAQIVGNSSMPNVDRDQWMSAPQCAFCLYMTAGI